jgi:hypothetical protein
VIKTGNSISVSFLDIYTNKLADLFFSSLWYDFENKVQGLPYQALSFTTTEYDSYIAKKFRKIRIPTY